jgi:hypothetical protein
VGKKKRTFGATHRDLAHITCTRRWNFSNGVPTFALGTLKVIAIVSSNIMLFMSNNVMLIISHITNW